jgi:hypothetical protein
LSNSTAQLVRRVCSLIRTLDRAPRTRAELARDWSCTTRNVNYTIDRARTLFRVRLEHVPGRGYVLHDTGILNRAVVARRST